MSLRDKLSENGSLNDYITQSNVKYNNEFDNIKYINIDELNIIEKQPFKEYTKSNKYLMLKDSIQSNGITNPLIVRLLNGKYYILSGRHRYLVGKEIGLNALPCIVKKNLSDDDANIILLDSNLCQRDELLPSEKAWSYKEKNDILKRKGTRTDLSNDTNKGVKTVELIANMVGVNKMEVIRYIRLTNLIPELLEKVDIKRISFNVGYQLSFISEKSQKVINSLIDTKNIAINGKVAKQAKEMYCSTNDDLTENQILDIINNNGLTKNISITTFSAVRKEFFNDFFNNDISDDEVINTIKTALKEYFDKNKII